jgi:nucleoside-diphosphate-sugar epimerase
VLQYPQMSKSLTDWRSLHGSSFQNIPVLVTGGAGFIGSHLALALVSLGAKVTVLDDLSNSIPNAQSTIAPAELVTGSILNEELLGRCAKDKKFIFHLAALGSVPRSLEQPRLYHEVNATGTLNVLEAGRAAKVRRVMFSASSSAYGDSPVLPKVETFPARPMSPYAASKAAGEMLCAAYSASFGLDTACLRYFNIFGPRQRADSAYAAVMAAFASALLSGRAPVIYGDGLQSRDFTYVDNAVHANLLAARCDKPLNGQPINIACGKSLTVKELAERMARELGRSDLAAVHKPARVGDVPHSLADLTLAEKLLNYHPVIALEPGLKATLDWYSAAR